MDFILTNKLECRLAHKIRATLGAHIRLVSLSLDGFLLLESNGIKNIEVLRNNVPPSLRTEVERVSRLSVIQLDRKICELHAAELESEISFGWEFFEKNDFFLGFKLASEILKWTDFSNLACDVALFDRGVPGDYSDNSLLISSLIRKCLTERGTRVTTVRLNAPSSSWDLEFEPVELDGLDFDNVTLMSAAFYDRQKYIDKFNGNVRTLDIQSPFFDVPVCNRRLKLRAASDNSTSSAFYRNVRHAYEVFFDELGSGLSSEFQSQIDRWVRRSRFQHQAFLYLATLFSRHQPKTAYTTNICGGLYGPFVSAAKLAKCFVEVVPHSTVINTPLDLEWVDLCGPAVRPELVAEFALSGNRGKELKVITEFKLLEREGSAKNIKRCGVLLNELDFSNGFSFINDIRLIERFLADMVSTFNSRGWEVVFRTKPDNEFQACLLPHGSRVDNLREGLADFLTQVGAVVSFAQVTSAIIPAWQRGKKVVVATDGPLSASEQMMVPGDNVLVIEGGFSVEQVGVIANFVCNS